MNVCVCGVVLLRTQKSVFVMIFEWLTPPHRPEDPQFSVCVWVCVWSCLFKRQMKCPKFFCGKSIFYCPFLTLFYFYFWTLITLGIDLLSRPVFNLTQHLHRSIQFPTQIFTNKQGFPMSSCCVLLLPFFNSKMLDRICNHWLAKKNLAKSVFLQARHMYAQIPKLIIFKQSCWAWQFVPS